MESLLPTDGNPRQPTPEVVLAEWIAAIESFHLYYHRLADYLTTYRIQHHQPGHSIRSVGQCQVDQLESLLKKMQEELDQLLCDINQPEQPTAEWNGKRLINHIRRLNRLNQQAQVVCQLASQPAS
jgi:hypothetical protein